VDEGLEAKEKVGILGTYMYLCLNLEDGKVILQRELIQTRYAIFKVKTRHSQNNINQSHTCVYICFTLRLRSYLQHQQCHVRYEIIPRLAFLILENERSQTQSKCAS